MTSTNFSKIKLDELENINLHAFIKNNDIKTENGLPLDFVTYRYLIDIYADESDNICAMKGAQIGFTTYEIIKSAHETRNENIDCIYVLPTADDVKKFSGGKTNRIIANNPIFQSWTEDKDSVEQKRFGKATIYYLGSWTERVALMISARKLIVDEYDRCKGDVVEQYDSRLQFQVKPKKAFFSNPSLPDFGIDKIYKQSDQKKWHITHGCGAKFPLTEECVDYKTEEYVCPICHREITDEERRLGEWVATSKGEWSGYWIPLWINPRIPASKIAEYKRTKSPEYFANFVAGLPYMGGKDKVSAQTIIQCLSERVNSHSEPVIIGVDSGLPYHIVCANKEGFFYYDQLKEPIKELEALLKRWPKAIIIADQGGDLTPMRDLQERYPGRVFLVWYRRDKRGLEMIDWGKDSEYGKVTADRNRLIQLFIDEMLDKRVTFNGMESEWQEYITHWLNIYRIWVPMPGEDDLTGKKEFRWERNGPDHFVHASIYCRIGLSKFAFAKAKIIGGEDMFAGISKGRIFDQPPAESPIGVILGPKAEL